MATDAWVWSKPTISSGKAYFGDFDGTVYAVDTSNGTKLWSKQLDHGSIRGAPAVTSDAIVVGTESGWLVGLAPDGSSKLWERNVESSLNADVVVSGSDVYIAPQGCVSQDNGKTKVYYITVDARSGQLTTADGVC